MKKTTSKIAGKSNATSTISRFVDAKLTQIVHLRHIFFLLVSIFSLVLASIHKNTT